MSRYIRKHRRHLFGFAAPAFVVLVLAVIGLSVTPGWIQNSYGTPGDSCSINDPNNQCDACNGEFCTGSVCANYTTNDPFIGVPNTNPAISNPQCPDINPFFFFSSLNVDFAPGCWNNCVNAFDSTFLLMNYPDCMPNDQVCEDMSGGSTSNTCRTGLCTTDRKIDPANPSGCDYVLSGIGTGTCINCEPPLPAGISNCGNGVCEVDNGETFDNCSVDCRVPGWVGPFDTDPVCESPPAIGFPVPPQPPFFGYCEDGDVCTENTCSGQSCITTDKTCDDTQEDLCCPAGCTSADDLDCIDPQECQPTPTPIPPSDLVEGSGIVPCSLQKNMNIDPVKGMLGVSALVGAIGILLVLRSRKS